MRISVSSNGRAVNDGETLAIKPAVPLIQGLALELIRRGVDVGLHVAAQGVVHQHLADQVVDAEVGPAGASHLAQVMAGPLTGTQSGKRGTGLALGQRPTILRRE
ncbi:hypothetical protein D3C77_539660 [compost metagenome]